MKKWCCFVLLIAGFCLGFILGKSRSKWAGFHPDNVLQISRALLETKGGCSHQTLEALRSCVLRLMDEVYFKGDIYNYHYDPVETEVLLCIPLEYELAYFSRKIKNGGQVPRFVFDHLRGYMRAMPITDALNMRSVGIETCGIVGLLNEYKKLDNKGFDKFMSSQVDGEYMREITNAMHKLNAQDWKED